MDALLHIWLEIFNQKPSMLQKSIVIVTTWKSKTSGAQLPQCLSEEHYPFLCLEDRKQAVVITAAGINPPDYWSPHFIVYKTSNACPYRDFLGSCELVCVFNFH